MRVKQNTTFVFMSFFAVFNIFSLFWWNLNNFTSIWTGVNLLNEGIWFCKVGNFIQFSSLELIAWFMVLVSIDRTLSVYVRLWRASLFKAKQAYWVSFILSAFILLMNINILVLFGYEANMNGTIVPICFKLDQFPQTYWMDTYGKISLFVYSVIPFPILVLSNIALVYKLITKPKLDTSANSKLVSSNRNNVSRMNSIVIIMTLLFVVCTLPVALASYLFNTIIVNEYGSFLITFLDSISFTYNALNFFISYFSNVMFRNEVRKLLFNQVVAPVGTSTMGTMNRS